MFTTQQVHIVDEDRSPRSASQCDEKIFTTSTFDFDAGMEAN